MTTQKPSALAGLQWLVNGIWLSKENPRLLLWLALTLAINYFLFAGIFFLLLNPCLVSIYRCVTQGEKASFGTFIAPLRDRTAPLLRLSVFYCLALAVLTILAACAFFLGAVTFGGHYHGGAGGVLILLILGSIFALPIIAILSIPFFMAFAFSPLLVAFQGQNAWEAIRHSFIIWFVNWKSLLVNSIAVTLLNSIVATFLYYVVFPLFSIGSIIIPVFIIATILLVFMSILFANYYQIYNALFPENHAPPVSMEYM
jgi:hypothetical protein